MNSVVSEKKFIQERLGIPYENLSQSYLRAETQLSNLSTYNFYLQRGQVAAPFVTEQLLELNDQFVITHFRISLRNIDPSTTATPTPTEQLNAQQYLYADPTAFTGNAANAKSIYNGNLSFIIDRKQFLPAFPTNAFYRVPTTQTAANAYFTASAIKTVNGFDNGLYGFYQTEPVKITGRQTLDISIDLGASVIMDDSSATYYAVLELRGYLLVNVKS